MLENINPLIIIAVIAVWTIPWKGVALWKAARRSDLGWFVLLLIINTVGILEIIYIYYVSRRKRAVMIDNNQ